MQFELLISIKIRIADDDCYYYHHHPCKNYYISNQISGLSGFDTRKTFKYFSFQNGNAGPYFWDLLMQGCYIRKVATISKIINSWSGENKLKFRKRSCAPWFPLTGRKRGTGGNRFQYSTYGSVQSLTHWQLVPSETSWVSPLASSCHSRRLLVSISPLSCLSVLCRCLGYPEVPPMAWEACVKATEFCYSNRIQLQI